MLVSKNRVRSQASPCEICGGRRGAGGRFLSGHQCSMYFSFMLVWPREQTGKTRAPSKTHEKAGWKSALKVCRNCEQETKLPSPPPPSTSTKYKHSHTCFIMEMHLFLHRSSVHFAQPIHYSQYKRTDTRRRYATAGEPQCISPKSDANRHRRITTSYKLLRFSICIYCRGVCELYLPQYNTKTATLLLLARC